MGSQPSLFHDSPLREGSPSVSFLSSRGSNDDRQILSKEQQGVLAESWKVAEESSTGHLECIKRFYRLMLLTGGEHIQRMFAYTELDVQYHMLTSVVEWALGNNFNETGLIRIGVLHSHLGVRGDDIELFGNCFIRTLEDVSEGNWKSCYREAWESVFVSIKSVIVPIMMETNDMIESVTTGHVNFIENNAITRAHCRILSCLKEPIVPQTESVGLQFTVKKPSLINTVNYAGIRAPLQFALEYIRCTMELYGRILYLAELDGKYCGFVDLRSATKLDSGVTQDGKQFYITIETHGGEIIHFLVFDSETLQEKWNVEITRHVKQFSSLQPLPNTMDIDRLTDEIFSEKQHLQFTPNDFEYVTLIGKGSFGNVLKVQHKKTQKVYAMKIIQKSNFSTPRNIVEVRRERNILETVDCPFIVKFYGFFQSDDKLFFLFDFLSGGELFYHLKCAHDHHYDEHTCRFYTAEIACALEHLRVRNIIHRDIKSDNFVLDGEGHVVLTDFGFAKIMKKADNCETNNATCGTLAYIAPEVLAPGPAGYGCEIDWWSLGVVLFTMLTGFFPFLRQTPAETAKAIVYQPLRFPSRVGTTHNARSLCRNLMHKNPKKRIASLSQLQLHPFFAGFNWNALIERTMTPPFIPDKLGANTKYFLSKKTQIHASDLSNLVTLTKICTANTLARENNVFGSFFFICEQQASDTDLNTDMKNGLGRLFSMRNESPELKEDVANDLKGDSTECLKEDNEKQIAQEGLRRKDSQEGKEVEEEKNVMDASGVNHNGAQVEKNEKIVDAKKEFVNEFYSTIAAN